MQKPSLSRRHFLAGSTAFVGASVAAQGRAHGEIVGTVRPPILLDIEKPGRTPNTPFAVNIEMWLRGSFEERIEDAAKLGYPAIEFWPHENKNIDAGAALLRKHGMTCAQFTAWGFGTELNHPDASPDKFLWAIEKSCAVAAKLPGCDLFTVVIGNDIDGLTRKQMHAAAVEKIKKAVPILERHKKTIIIEPMNPYDHPGHCLYGSADGIAILKAVGSEWVKLNWDLFHMQRYEGNLIDNMRKGKDSIGYLQLADSPDRYEPGTGEINYTNVFKAIKEIGYTRPVGLECRPQDADVVRAAKRIHSADTW